MTKCKRVLFLYSEIMPYNVSLFRMLSLFNCEVVCVSWGKGKKKTSYKPEDVPNVQYLTFREYLLLARSNGSFDAVVISGWIDKKYVALGILYRLMGTPTICCIDTQYRKDRAKLYDFFKKIKLFQNIYSHFWVPGVRQKLVAKSLGYDDEHICEDFLAADTSLFESVTPLFSTEKQCLDILFVGRLVVEKRFDILLEAVVELSKTYNVKLHVVGEGPLKGLLADNYSCVKHYGFLEQSELCKLLPFIDVFVLPSLYEPWGVVIQEMAAAGLPIITTEAVGASDKFVSDGRNGFVLPDNCSSDALLEALKKFNTYDRNARLRMSIVSKELAKKVSSDSAAKQLLRVLC